MKTWATPREELICGKIDEAERIGAKAELVEIMPILQYIRHDAERMEQALIRRKDEVASLSAKIRRVRISQLRRMRMLASKKAIGIFLRAHDYHWEHPRHERMKAMGDRLDRFVAACLAEIERLRGEG